MRIERRGLLSVVLCGACLVASPAVRAEAGDRAPLSLPAALSLARRSPRAVLAALSTWQARSADERAARAAYWPRASFLLSATVRHQALEEPPPSTSGGTQAYNASASVDLTLFDFGRRAADVTASEQQRRAADGDIESARLRAQLAVAEAFLRAASAEQLAATYDDIVQRRQRLQEATARLVQAQLKPPVDEKRALLEVVNAETERQAFVYERARQQAALWAALGLPQATERALRAPQLPELERLRTPAADGAGCHDPRILAARARSEALAAAAKSGQRAKLPVLSLQGSVGYNRLAELYGNPAPPPIIVSATSFEASAMLMLRWDGLDPILWHRASAAEQEALAAARTAEQAAVDTGLQARQADIDASEARLRLSQRTEALEVARAAFELQRERYQNGVASLLEFLDTQVQLDQAEVDVAATRFRLYVALVRSRLLGDGCIEPALQASVASPLGRPVQRGTPATID